VEVLRGSRKGKTTKKIVAEVLATDGVVLRGKTPAATIAAILAVEAAKVDGLFERVAPGTFRLRPQGTRYGEPVSAVGNRIRRLREEQGLSQRDLASPGVSYSYLSRVEAGTRQPSEKALRALAAKLGTTAHYLESGGKGICPHCGK
jgi:DNA-binding transcriptional regulator YiaG